jgi:hypothetical protein
VVPLYYAAGSQLARGPSVPFAETPHVVLMLRCRDLWMGYSPQIRQRPLATQRKSIS